MDQFKLQKKAKIGPAFKNFTAYKSNIGCEEKGRFC